MTDGRAGATPRVSVVLPTYNAPDLLTQTLASVFAQTFVDYEVVVVDDGSTGDTAGRLATIADPRLRVITQANGGIGAARNRGIDEARGELLAFLDHDDLWYPEKLALQVRYLDATPAAVGCTVPWAFAAEPVIEPRPAAAEAFVTQHRPLRAWADGRPMMSSALMFRRSAVGDSRFQTQRASIEDTALYVRLLARGPFGVAGTRTQMLYRTHPRNASGGADFWFNGIRRLWELDAAGYFDECRGPQRDDLDELLLSVARLAAVNQANAGRRGRAIELYRRSFRANLRRGRWRFLLGLPPMLLRPGKR